MARNAQGEQEAELSLYNATTNKAGHHEKWACAVRPVTSTASNAMQAIDIKLKFTTNMYLGKRSQVDLQRRLAKVGMQHLPV